ncbi:tRNA lysidine(34) synthetase TilS [Alloscardovia theropitheci]|uniref:tRNA(Ile)-lysidine synthase n=1 Tax=Alloscardovia theropitheci TaxID=2496842 RepID=A0A4R0QZI5_9BIFI|nr:tRNA lysidine(34) synthetase TilS [Alloscardovia theropitheci]TCD54056.1 tRNA lysidine(34) synthetase TilS [Alloscardovia theropitheci]
MIQSELLHHAQKLVRDSVQSITEVQEGSADTSDNNTQPSSRPLILIACSGGRDSLALAAVAQRACANQAVRYGDAEYKVGALIINHQLQENSDLVARQAAERCEELGLSPVRVVDVTVEKTRSGVESDARDARYAALVSEAKKLGAIAVLVAHTQDDVAETIMIQLIRSAHIDALSGISPVTYFDGIPVVRPFLSMSREQTTQICDELNLKYWDDPTNGDDVEGELAQDYPLRSRIRHDVIPLINRVADRDIRSILSIGSQFAREDLEIIENAVDDAYTSIVREKNGNEEIKIRALHAFAPAVQRRVIARFLENINITPTRSMIFAIIELSNSEQKKKEVYISSTLRANKLYNVIQLWKDREYANF